jgi:DNA invertase Pin-like site-specific DNA recombinase
MTRRPRRSHADLMQRLIGYVRVSSVAGRDDERFKSPAQQRDFMRQWAQARYGDAHEWIEWFEELDQTGTTIDRPELNKVHALAIDKQANIIVYDWSRYTRSVSQGLMALAELAESGVKVLSVSEDVDPSTPDGELSLTLFLAMNQHFAKKMSSSWKRSIRSNVQQGWWHGVIPYGYRAPTAAEAKKIGRTSGVIVPDKKAAKHIKEIFRRYLAGEAIYAIGRYGVTHGWFKKDGTAREIVSNPVYAGFVRIAETAPARSKKTGELLRDNHGRVRNIAKPETVAYYRGKQEPLVSAKDVVRARKRLEREAKPAAPRSALPRWSAATRTVCYSCGRKLQYHDKSAMVTGTPGIYLTCTNRNCPGRPGSVRIEDLEAQLAALIKSMPIQVKDVRKEMRARQRAVKGDSSATRAQLLAERRKKKQLQTEAAATLLSKEYLKLGMTQEEAVAAVDHLRRQVEKLDEQLDRLGPEVRTTDEITIAGERIGTLADLWDQMIYSERVEALEALGAIVKIKPSTKHAQPLDGRLVLSLSFDPSHEFAARVAKKAAPATTRKKPAPKRRARA